MRDREEEKDREMVKMSGKKETAKRILQLKREKKTQRFPERKTQNMMKKNSKMFIRTVAIKLPMNGTRSKWSNK